MNLYSFAKKKNSTATPSGSPLGLSCVLKAGCSVENPIIGIDQGMAWNPSSYNYAMIGTFSRYYYVASRTWENGLWWFTLSVDVLASFKTAILNSTCYVARASAQYDGTISDGMFPATVKSVGWRSYWNRNPQRSPWERDFSDGFYVVGIINNDGDSVGAVSYYAFTPTQFAALKSYLLGSSTWTDIETTNPDLGDNLYKSLFNPYQYISTVNWFPLAWSATWGTAVSSLKFGWWVLSGISCYRLTTYIHSFVSALEAGAHVQSYQRGVYLNAPPYSTYRLLAPPWGEFTLDGSLIVNGNYYDADIDGRTYTPISVAIQVDFISGQGDLIVTCNIGLEEPATLVHSQTAVCVPIQIAQINNDGWGQVRNRIETAANVFGNMAGMNIPGLVSSVSTGIINGIDTRIPHVQENGNNGSIGVYRIPFSLENVFTLVADDAPADKGRPLCKEIQLGQLLTGYVQTVGAHVAVAGTEAEIDEINTALDGGIYLE